MDDVDVGRNARLNRVIVDKGVRIPQGHSVGFDLKEDAKKFTVTESGIVVIPKGTLFWPRALRLLSLFSSKGCPVVRQLFFWSTQPPQIPSPHLLWYRA